LDRDALYTWFNTTQELELESRVDVRTSSGVTKTAQ
jgi:hypothetical protein